ncbi:MAG TPA: type II toxin-antitoxin system VapC family toxin [Polyangiaceae bacterium]|nr:type II toxin-antitoxin system VapC family toxin [Polyangiaceae bacterium]
MLVDTNVISELMRPKPSGVVLAWAERQEEFALSVVCLEEIMFGLQARPSPRLSQWFDEFVANHCEILPVTAAVARRCAMLRGQTRSRGHQRTQTDGLIAATAYEHGLALATRNVRDFEGCGIPLFNPFQA